MVSHIRQSLIRRQDGPEAKGNVVVAIQYLDITANLQELGAHLLGTAPQQWLIGCAAQHQEIPLAAGQLRLLYSVYISQSSYSRVYSWASIININRKWHYKKGSNTTYTPGTDPEYIHSLQYHIINAITPFQKTPV